MAFMYTLNSKRKGWWDEVTLVVWGPSTELLAADTELQQHIAEIKDSGVEVLACRRCADLYGVTVQLEKLGLEVIYMGEPLTGYLKSGCKVLTV
ncbi:MAG: DsrE family protein [Firmicutes bacterium]|nr:DsrE family protein [Bacillota bacterium]